VSVLEQGVPAPCLSLPSASASQAGRVLGGRLTVFSLWPLGSAYVLPRGRYHGLQVRLQFTVVWPPGVQADLHVLPSCGLAELGFLSLQIFVGMTNFEPVVQEFEFSAAM